MGVRGAPLVKLSWSDQRIRWIMGRNRKTRQCYDDSFSIHLAEGHQEWRSADIQESPMASPSAFNIFTGGSENLIKTRDCDEEQKFWWGAHIVQAWGWNKDYRLWWNQIIWQRPKGSFEDQILWWRPGVLDPVSTCQSRWGTISLVKNRQQSCCTGSRPTTDVSKEVTLPVQDDVKSFQSKEQTCTASARTLTTPNPATLISGSIMQHLLDHQDKPELPLNRDVLDIRTKSHWGSRHKNLSVQYGHCSSQSIIKKPFNGTSSDQRN